MPITAVCGLPADLVALSRIDVRNEPGGAPYLLVGGEPAGVDISLSDRSGWAVCVVAGGGPVGCDLEIVEPRSRGFLRDYLAPPERAYVRHAADGDVAANLVWSAKESALKVLRTGLRRDARSVEVTIVDGPPGQWSPLSVRTREGSELPGWWRRDGRTAHGRCCARRRIRGRRR
jgi:4'-phosphopantetheinyl transferase